MRSSLTLEAGALVYRTPYLPALVEALKSAIPSTERRWDGGRKVWLVSPTHLDTLKNITQAHLGETLQCQLALGHQAPAPETRVLDVRYVGVTKDRGNGEFSSYAWSSGGWNVVFPETVLREWYCAEQRPDEAPTLYATLGVKRGVAESDVKTAYRRLALQWHPDVAKEPDAAEMFMAIKHAYDVLSDPMLRARYDAGLALAERTTAQRPVDASITRWVHAGGQVTGYRPPLRCGLVLTTGSEVLGRFVVDTVLAWEDIRDGQGRVLVTSWPVGGDTFTEEWR